MWLPRLLLALLCLLPTMALSQGAKYSDYTIDQFGHAVGSVQVRVCATTTPANPPPTSPCSPLATLYTDQTLTFTAANPLTSDAVGNFSFYAPAGFYILQFYPSGINGPLAYAQTVQLGGAGGGGGSGTVTSVSSTNPTLLSVTNPTTTPALTLSTLGTGTLLATTSAAAPVSNKCVELDANGNLVIATSNAPCGVGVGGVTSLTGDGALINNSGSTGAVTLTVANAGAHTYWGNNTGSTAAPGYFGIVNADLPGAGTLTVGTSAPLGGGGSVALGGTLNLTCAGCLTSVTAHNLLSATHGDTTTHTVVRGDLIAGIGTVPSWTAVAKGGTNTYPKWNSSGDVVASTNPASGTGSPTACINQFTTGFTLNADAAPSNSCTTDVLASAQHANQGTTTTVLHGNAAGNPSWAAVTSADTTGTFPATAHNLLSATHGDTTAGTVAVGDLITGQTGPTWARLAANATATKKYLQSVSSGAASWQQIAYADVSGTPTLFYQTVQNAGTNLAQEPKLNFTGSGVSCVDNAGVSSDCTITSGGGSNLVGATLFSTTTLTGPSNSATETTLLSTTGISGTKTIPANTFGNGTVMQVELSGFYSTPAITVDNLTLRVKCGATVLASKVVSGLVVSATNQAARIWLNVHAIGTGASGSLLINTIAEFTGTTLTPSEAAVVNTTAVAYDFTTSCAFDVTAQWAAAQAGESISAVGAAWIPGAPVFSVNGQVGAVAVGTVTSVATTTPITGGTINTTGTIGCATCVTSAAALTNNALMLGGGGQASSTLGSLGTTTTLLHGNAAGAPSFGAVVQGDVTNGYVDLATNQTIAANKTFSGITLFNQAAGHCYTDTQVGADLGAQVAACLTANPNGVYLDSVNYLSGSTQTFTSNPFAAYEKRITWETGNYTIQYDMGSFFVDHPSHFHWIGHNTTAGESTATSPVYPGSFISGRLYTTTGSITTGTNTLTVASATGFEVGNLVGIVFARGPENAQQTTLNAAIATTGATSFTVTNTAGWATQPDPIFYPDNFLLIDTELLKCTTVTGGAGGTFSVCSRGLYGTTAATHSNGAVVKAVGALFAEVVGVSGTTITLDINATQTVTNALVQTGVTDTYYDGDITFSGNTSAAGSVAIACWYCTTMTAGPGLSIQNWNFGGIYTVASRYNQILVRKFTNNGNTVTGADIWLFGQDKYNTIVGGSHKNCGASGALFINDRSTQYEIYNGGSSDNVAYLGPINNCILGVQISGQSSNNFVYAGVIDGTNPTSGTSNGVGFTTANWTSTQNPGGNTVVVGTINVTSQGVYQSGMTAGSNNTVWVGYVQNGSFAAPLLGDSYKYFGEGIALGGVTLSAGWGSTATYTLNSGSSGSMQITITSAGTGQAANPTVTLTQFSTNPALQPCKADMNGGTGSGAYVSNSTISTSAPVFTYNAVPVSGSTYTILVRCGA